jgi:hypothetical protein
MMEQGEYGKKWIKEGRMMREVGNVFNMLERKE